jgi:hypothetical protein
MPQNTGGWSTVKILGTEDIIPFVLNGGIWLHISNHLTVAGGLVSPEMHPLGEVNILYLFSLLCHRTLECLKHQILFQHICEAGRDVGKIHKIDKGVVQLGPTPGFLLPRASLWKLLWPIWHFLLGICSGGEKKEENRALPGLKQGALKSLAHESWKPSYLTYKEYEFVILQTFIHNFPNTKVSTIRCFPVFTKRTCAISKMFDFIFHVRLSFDLLTAVSPWCMITWKEMVNKLWHNLNLENICSHRSHKAKAKKNALGLLIALGAMEREC